MTMVELAGKLDAILQANDYAVFGGFRDYLMDRADVEWKHFKATLPTGPKLAA